MTPIKLLTVARSYQHNCAYCNALAVYLLEQNDGTADLRYGTNEYLCWKCRVNKERLWIASAPYEEILANVYVMDSDILLPYNIELYKRRLAGETIINWGTV